VRQERADHVHQAGDVEVDLALPVVDLQLLDPGDELDARVVEDEIGLAEAVLDLLGGPPDGLAVGDVGGDGQRGAAVLLDGRDEVVQPVLAAGEDDDGGAKFGEALGGSAPMPLEAPETTATRPVSGVPVRSVDWVMIMVLIWSDLA
jgi:hypothetical protein